MKSNNNMKNPDAALSVVALLSEPLAVNAMLIDPVSYAVFANGSSAQALFDELGADELEKLPPTALHPVEAGDMASWPGDRESLIRDQPDGAAGSGHSWYFNGVSSITFTFSAALLGALPHHAGLVWTDSGFANIRRGFDSVLFEAFDRAGNLLGIIGPSALGDESFAGQTAEDRFFGITSTEGIGSVRISLLHSTVQGLDRLQNDLAGLASIPLDFDLAATLAVLVVGRGSTGFARRHLNG
ncbi:hypothetical protein [Nitrosovibrio sp. Nv17]|uniref:hypothetical protein n=1 Tax=Nitrosovibrio sp. Nv17 TaxID=1855339 RepID=UPI000908746F|nr:hypothetical protein [Nitrosovibrio sp. Nv17]SFW40153.1 hypothetical protein SAMN05216414_1376 [Nitrosovibrio sp. Nv17]